MALWLAQEEAPSLDYLHSARCNACPLKQAHLENKVKSWAIPARGSKHPDVYVIGIGPGEKEDAAGRCFVGPTGNLLNKSLSEVGITNIRYNNITRTRSLDNDPPKTAIEACRKFIEEDVVTTKPKVIIGLGGLVLHWIIGYDVDETIYNWRRRKIPVKFTANGETHFCWFVPTTHPASILRAAPSFVQRAAFQRSQDEEMELFNKDLAFAKGLIDTSPDSTDFEIPNSDTFELINGDLAQALNALNYFSSIDSAIDLETTKIRPYYTNSRILCLGLSDTKRNVSICLEHPEAKWTSNDLKKLWKAILDFLNSNSRKIAHNMPFEFEWLAYRFGRIRRDVIECTMGQVFCIDPRRVQRLDFLCLLNFGFRLKSLSPMIHIDRLENDPWDVVGKYNVYDCYFEYKLFQKQKEQIEQDQLEQVYVEQRDRIPAYAYTQLRGLHLDQERVSELENKYGAQIKIQLMKIYNDPDFKRMLQKIKGLTPYSPLRLKQFFQQLGHKVDDVDEETLSQVKHPVAKYILGLREFLKLKGTYLDSLVPNQKDTVVWPDGLIHPQYSLTFAVNSRSSARDPNIQNFPKHGNIEPRSVVIPPKGHIIVSADYGQIEYRALGIESQAAELLDYIRDKTKDIHTDWAKIILELYPPAIESVAKEDLAKAKDNPIAAYRQVAKNGFVFAKCYRAGIEKIMQTLGVPEWVSRKLDKMFWERLPNVKKWHEQLDWDYDHKGYVTNKLGRKRSWFKKRTELYNYPVSSLASDIVKNAFIRLSRYAEESEQEQFQPVMEIHDDLDFYMADELWKTDVEVVADMMLDCPFDFVNVPLAVEVSVGPNWAKLSKYKNYLSE